jgi:YidC/Oxa1 family membrane protein insertase|tara:strand:- start:1860 stop:3575 length:1716 start_codon:yes stop_codon:yes gene_type:complete
MDMQRVLLFAALAVTGYLLILAWNRDYHGPVPVQSVEPTQGVVDTPDLPDVQSPVASTSEPTTEELPSVEIEELPKVEPEREFTPQDTIAVSSDRRLVKVTTDTLDVWIDPRGGDITRIALPKYPAALEVPDVPFVLIDHRNSYEGQSGLIGKNGPDGSKSGRPLYSTVTTDYQLGDSTDLKVELSFMDPTGVRIVKRFTFHRGSYLFDVDFEITNNTDELWQGNFFAQMKRDGLVPAFVDENAMGLRPYVGGATFTLDAPYFKLEFDDIAEEPYQGKIEGGYMAMVQHYFVTAWVPKEDGQYTYTARKSRDKDIYLMGYTAPAMTVEPGGFGSYGAYFYAGPKDQYKLKEIAKGLELTVDYGFLWFIAQILFDLLTLIHGFVGNWGVAIILLTVLVKALLYPLSAASFKSMAKMRKLAPEMQRLKAKHGEDKQKFSQAMMDLYKKEGANPLGGCLPIMLQMPVFLALYWTLMESVELRQAPFALWITDLSVMDPYFVLPILMGISMFLTQMMQPEPPDPIQAKVFKMMPIMFTVFFLWFPSGLVLYWLVNNILSILQQWMVNRQFEKATT